MRNHKPPAPVSVVIPCYRCAGTIRRAVASVHAQTTRPVEVVLVDDASGDNTEEVLSHLANEYPEGWIKVIRLKENRGAASARNAGWGAAVGEYIAFLDADDTWHRLKLERQLSIMQRMQATLSCHELPVYAGLGSDTISEAHVTTVNPRLLLFSNRIFTPTVIVRRDSKFRFPEGQRYSEDYMLWLRICLSGARCIKVHSPLAFRHKAIYGESGLSSNLAAMELHELSNYRVLWRDCAISLPQFLGSSIFSLLKFARRLAVVSIRNALKLRSK